MSSSALEWSGFGHLATPLVVAVCAARFQVAGRHRCADFCVLQDSVPWSLATSRAASRNGTFQRVPQGSWAPGKQARREGHLLAVSRSRGLRQAFTTLRAPFQENPCRGRRPLPPASKPSPSLLFTVLPWGTVRTSGQTPPSTSRLYSRVPQGGSAVKPVQ